MLSFASVISVNLIATVAAGPTDSARVVAAVTKATASIGSAITVERRVLGTARRYLGTRYRMGGTKPTAFDCSGFVRYVFAKHGVELPRTAREQSAVGRSVAVGADSLRVGTCCSFERRAVARATWRSTPATGASSTRARGVAAFATMISRPRAAGGSSSA